MNVIESAPSSAVVTLSLSRCVCVLCASKHLLVREISFLLLLWHSPPPQHQKDAEFRRAEETYLRGAEAKETEESVGSLIRLSRLYTLWSLESNGDEADKLSIFLPLPFFLLVSR